MTSRRAGANLAEDMVVDQGSPSKTPGHAPAAMADAEDTVAAGAGTGIETGADIVAAVLDAGGDPRLLGALATRLEQSHDETTRAAVARYVEVLVEVRQRARTDGRYQQADEIRRRLGTLGVDLSDAPSGTTWRFTAPDAGAG